MKKILLFLLLCIVGYYAEAQESELSFTQGENHNIQGKWNGGMAVGDFNEDDFLDVITIGVSYETLGIDPDTGEHIFLQTIRSHLHINNGNKTFTESTPFEHLAGGNPIVSDFNNDGHEDVFISGYKDNNDYNNPENYVSFLYSGNGDGSFSEQEIIFPWESVFLRGYGCDLNNDGNMDIVFERVGGYGIITEVRVVHGNGDGTFTEVSTGLPNFTTDGYATHDVKFADIDGNGYMDILYGGNGNSFLFLNQGNFTFEEIEEPIRVPGGATIPIPLTYFVSYGFGNINGDDLPDLVIRGINLPSHEELLTYFLINNGDNTFTRSQYFSYQLIGVFLHDFDNDNRSEIFSDGSNLEDYWEQYDPNVPSDFWSSLYTMTEDGIFDEHTYIKLYPELMDDNENNCVAYDFDNDGDDDLLYIGRYGAFDGARAGLYWNNEIQMATEESDYKEFMIYPNPTNGIINFPEIIKEISVYDLSGKIVKMRKFPAKKLDISSLPKGNYIIKGTTVTGKIFTKKILKD